MLFSGVQAVPAAAQRHVSAHHHNQPGSTRPRPTAKLIFFTTLLLCLLCLLCLLGWVRGEPAMIDGDLV